MPPAGGRNTGCVCMVVVAPSDSTGSAEAHATSSSISSPRTGVTQGHPATNERRTPRPSPSLFGGGDDFWAAAAARVSPRACALAVRSTRSCSWCSVNVLASTRLAAWELPRAVLCCCSYVRVHDRIGRAPCIYRTQRTSSSRSAVSSSRDRELAIAAELARSGEPHHSVC